MGTRHNNVTNNVKASSLSAHSNSVTQINLENELFALTPQMKVFVSNLPLETSTKAIENHIAKTVPNVYANNVVVEKFQFASNRSYSSFVIKIVNQKEIFDALIDPASWPQFTIVHEYRQNFRRNQRRNHRRM